LNPTCIERRQQPCKPPDGAPNPEISEGKDEKKTTNPSVSAYRSFLFPSGPCPAALWATNETGPSQPGRIPLLGRTSGLAGVSEGARQAPSRPRPPGRPSDRPAASPRLAFVEKPSPLVPEEVKLGPGISGGQQQHRQGARAARAGKVKGSVLGWCVCVSVCDERGVCGLGNRQKHAGM